MVITVQCPSCASTFPVDPNKIPEKGVSVRCSTCTQIFRVERPPEPAPPPPPAAPEPVIDEPVPPITEPEGSQDAPPTESEASGEVPPTEPEASFELPPPAAPEPVIDEPPSVEPPDFGTFEPADEGDAWRDRSPEAETDFSIGVEEPSAEAPEPREEEWVFETEEQIDAGSLDVEPMETVESSVEEARDESAFFGAPPGFESTEVAPEPEEEPEALPEIAAPEPTIVPPPEPTPPPVSGFTFGKRDPKDKARRLARVLVSDMIMYNPDRHERALANGTLKEDFADEIEKSWKEYVEQVGEEMATGHDFWADALNDVLAKGQRVF